MRFLIMIFLLAMSLITTPPTLAARHGDQGNAPVRIKLDIESDQGIRQTLKKEITQALARIDRATLTEENYQYRLHIIGIDSEDAGIYCDSIITLSIVVVDENSTMKDHWVTTIPSEHLPKTSREIVENFYSEFLD